MPDAAPLHLFADTRYRLVVNGRVLGHGPARFKVSHPEFDSYDIAPYLRVGRNVIAVAVCSYGWGTFLTDDSLGGLIAWGGVESGTGETVSFDTPDEWKVTAATGYRSDTALMSFALGMAEYQDTRGEPADWTAPEFDDAAWGDAVPLADTGNWGALAPRSIPLIGEVADRAPQSIDLFRAAPLDEVSWSCTVTRTAHDHGVTALALDVEAAEEIRTTVTLSDGRLFVNGREAAKTGADENAARNAFRVDLKKGTNRLLIALGLWRGFSTCAVAWPRDAGVTLSSGTGRKFPDEDQGEDACLPGWLKTIEAGRAAELPAIEMTPGLAAVPAALRGWRTTAWQGRAAGLPLRVDTPEAGAYPVWVMDFAREVLGRVIIDFEAAPGTVIQMTGSERLEADGTVSSGFQSTRLIHTVVARGGRQRWQAMHPIGFRYLEVSALGRLEDFVLHDLRVARFEPPRKETGRFLCSDAVLNEVWQLCRETQVASIEDAFIDCPWRERGLYTGDQIIQYYVNLALFADHSMMRRCTGLFFQTQGEGGLLAPCTHRLEPPRHPDYSALSIESLWHYWARSGDLDFVRATADAMERLLDGLNGLRGDDGIADGTGLFPYIDMSRTNREGKSAALNLFIYGAFRFAAQLLDRIGRGEAAARWKGEADALRKAIDEGFLDREAGLYRDRLPAEAPEAGPSALANALALYYGLLEGDTAKTALAFVEDCALQNAAVEHPKVSFDFHFSAYSSYYALAVLYRYGCTETAERFMRREWRRMLDGGAWTCWEYFVPSHSLCHAWGASPAWYLSACVLGVRYAEPGNPDRLVFDPHPGTLEWAEGVFPHARGPIRVRWERTPGGLVSEIDAPQGIEWAEA